MLPLHLTPSPHTLPNPFSWTFRSHNTLSSSSHSFSKVLFSFPSQYFFAIGFPVIFRLWWILSPLQFILPNKFTLFPRPLFSSCNKVYEAFTLSGWLFRTIHPTTQLLNDPVEGATTTPVFQPQVIETLPDAVFNNSVSFFFIRHYSRNHCYFLFLPLLICLS